jgi:hypothetical protein
MIRRFWLIAIGALTISAAFGDDRYSDRKEWEKDGREAIRESEKDRRETIREADKDYREAVREREKDLRESEREREKEWRDYLKDRRKADKEWRKGLAVSAKISRTIAGIESIDSPETMVGGRFV